MIGQLTEQDRDLVIIGLAALRGDEAAKQLLERHAEALKAANAVLEEFHAKAEELRRSDQDSEH